jgi:metallophosphoesterase superfamily enzyme
MPVPVNVLHLSDLHFGIEPDPKHSPAALAQRKNTLDGLLKSLEKLDKNWRPTIIAISGDIGWKARPRFFKVE